MFNRSEEVKRRLFEVVQMFRQKGAINPDKAMTPEELGLPPRFEQAMHRRLGQLGIFVEVEGKYYLDENRLKELREQRAKAGTEGYRGDSWNRTRKPSWYSYAGIFLILPLGLIVSVVLFYLLAAGVVSFFPGELLLIVVIVMVVLAVIRVLFWRSRQRWWRQQWTIETRSCRLWNSFFLKGSIC